MTEQIFRTSDDRKTPGNPQLKIGDNPRRVMQGEEYIEPCIPKGNRAVRHRAVYRRIPFFKSGTTNRDNHHNRDRIRPLLSASIHDHRKGRGRKPQHAPGFRTGAQDRKP
jgi:hypothetical protein